MDSERIPEELFNEYIEFDDGKEFPPNDPDMNVDDESDKENNPLNVKVKKPKHPKTNQQQFNLIIAFANGITEVIWFYFSLIIAKTFRF